MSDIGSSSTERRTGRILVRLIPDVPAIAARFPWAAAALALLGIALLSGEQSLAILRRGVPPFQNQSSDDSAVLGLMAAAIALTGIALAAEKGRWTLVQRHSASALWALLCLLAACAAIYQWTWALPNLHLLLGASLLGLFAGAAWGPPPETALWRIVRTAAILALAVFASWVLANLIPVLSAVGPQTFHEMSSTVRLIMIALVSLYALHWLPADDDGSRGSGYMALLLDRLLVPIGLLVCTVAALTLVPATFGGRIAHLPLGAWHALPGPTMLLAAITLLYLAAAPIQGQSSLPTRLLLRAFPYLAAIPIAAILYVAYVGWRQTVPHHGAGYFIEDERFWLWTLPVVTIAVALGAFLRPAWRDLRLAAIAASVFLVLASLGPWSERAFVARQARAQIAAALTEAEWLRDGRLVPGPPIARNPQLLMRLNHWIPRLEQIDRLASIAPWFKGLPGDPFAAYPNSIAYGQPGFLSPHVLAALGGGSPGERPPPRQGSTTVSINAMGPGQQLAPIPGYARMAGPIRFGGGPVAPVGPGGGNHWLPSSVHRIGHTLSVETSGASIQITETVPATGPGTGGTSTARIDLRPMLLRLAEETRARMIRERERSATIQSGTPPQPPRPPTPPTMHSHQLVEASPEPLKAALLITQMQATLDPAPGNELIQLTGQAWLLLGPGPEPAAKP